MKKSTVDKIKKEIDDCRKGIGIQFRSIHKYNDTFELKEVLINIDYLEARISALEWVLRVEGEEL